MREDRHDTKRHNAGMFSKGKATLQWQKIGVGWIRNQLRKGYMKGDGSTFIFIPSVAFSADPGKIPGGGGV